MLTIEKARREIVREWRSWARRPEKPTPNDHFLFFLQLESAGSPWLGFKCSGDKWQRIKVWLAEADRL